MILRSVPEVFGKDVTSEIGAPQDYTKNKQKASFPDSYDLRVPGAERPAAAETMEVEVSAAARHVSTPSRPQEEEKHHGGDAVMLSATPSKS